jgi:hypothetical protein
MVAPSLKPPAYTTIPSFRSTSFWSFAPRLQRYPSNRQTFTRFATQSLTRLNSTEVIMMNALRALVGGCFVFAVIGFVVVVPLGWCLVLGISLVNPSILVAATRIFW